MSSLYRRNGATNCMLQKKKINKSMIGWINRNIKQSNTNLYCASLVDNQRTKFLELKLGLEVLNLVLKSYECYLISLFLLDSFHVISVLLSNVAVTIFQADSFPQ